MNRVGFQEHHPREWSAYAGRDWQLTPQLDLMTHRTTEEFPSQPFAATGGGGVMMVRDF